MTGEQTDRPRSESIEFFKKAVSGHSHVDDVIVVNDQRYKVLRKSGRPIELYLTDLYTVGITDYLDIRSRNPEVNCIVTISAWNGYTRQAKEQAAGERVGLFLMKEFMPALRLARFWNYVKKDDS